MTVKINPPRTSAADQFARVEQKKPKLDAATDGLNVSIHTAEKAVASLRPGVAVQVNLWTDDEQELSGTDLVFRKWDREWRFVVERWSENQPDTDSALLLVDAPRETRLIAVDHFYDLLEEMEKAIDEEIERVNKATAAVDGFIEFVRNRGKEGAPRPPPHQPETTDEAPYMEQLLVEGKGKPAMVVRTPLGGGAPSPSAVADAMLLLAKSKKGGGK